MNSAIKKMVLVDPKVLKTTTTEAIKEAIKPTVSDTLNNKIRSLDDELNDVISNKSLDESTKAMLYQSILNKYLRKNREYRYRQYHGYVPTRVHNRSLRHISEPTRRS